jgi:sterol desaturase/sphingolipid hydroxylase (fatty acid hydroxylase superfamily)
MGVGIAVVCGLVMANFYEWWIHKYILHVMGKKNGNFWRFHWDEHHGTARKHANADVKVYLKEILALLLLVGIHTPMLYVSMPMFVTIATYAILYYTLHRYSHLNPVWGKKYMRWHWDHHMGKNQDSNWCILFPLFDYILGTREKSQHT